MAQALSKSISRAEGARRDVLVAARAALDAADPLALIRRELRLEGSRLSVGKVRLDLDGYRRVVAVGGGKASGLMAVGVHRELGDRLDSCTVIVPGYQKGLPRLTQGRYLRSTHPLPSEKGAEAVKVMLRALDGVGPEDLVVVLLSGGGSAMMPSPPRGVTVKELERTTRLLMNSGAAVGDVNCVRKHLSRFSGGRLVERVNGARVLTLVISDVAEDDLSTIASGPTVPDPTTFADARRILEGRKIWLKAPPSVRRAIMAGIAGRVDETPKPGSPIFEKVNNVVIGSNFDACSAAKRSLEARGYRVALRTQVTGEAKVVGRALAKLAVSQAGPFAAVWGGETTVTVRGRGVGGRNQEAALAAALELEDSQGTVLMFFGTDGVDGPTGAAGAVVDGSTIRRAKRLRLDPRRFLRNDDSHTFFRALGDLVVTGPTGTNVNDVMIAAKR